MYCNETFWMSEVFVNDNITGLRKLAQFQPETDEFDGSKIARYEHYDLISYEAMSDFVAGSIKDAHFRFEAPCCLKGFKFRLMDEAENWAECSVGKVASKAARQTISTHFSLFIIIVVVVQLRNHISTYYYHI